MQRIEQFEPIEDETEHDQKGPAQETLPALSQSQELPCLDQRRQQAQGDERHDECANVEVGDQCVQRDEERINQGSKGAACDSLSLHRRPVSHHLLRRDRNGHKEQADESGSGTGARDEEVEEFRRKITRKRTCQVK